MTAGKLEKVKAWLTKAKHDLEVAELIGKNDTGLLDNAIYHCQQCAEKALKGFLVLHDIRFPKTHNLLTLIELAEPIQPDFSVWKLRGDKSDGLRDGVSVS